MDLIRLFFRKDNLNKLKIPEDKEFGWNIYQDHNFKEHKQKFHLVHFIIKYKLIVPTIMLLSYLTRKVRPKFNQPYDKNFRIFNMAFDQALWLWAEYLTFHTIEKDRTEYELYKIKRTYSSYSVDLIKRMKHIVYSIISYDTAYRELFNFLMFELTKEMNMAYKDQHIFIPYSDKGLFDITYKNAWEVLSDTAVSQRQNNETIQGK
ncbi:MAG: hypothetical protein GWP09_02860 [Nitrospiraceae bacterium]|nr:hypothetical protein [Nitrospiraceae bacterium]